MATRKDQLQSHQFLGQRMVSALVTRESDPEQPPFRRPLTSAIGGAVIGLLVLAGVFVYGLVVPGGNKAWQAGDAVIVEKETGTRFVYLDGRLHPVTNYVSALLAIGKKVETRRVSQKSLVNAPRGPRIGIMDAPDALPPAKRLLSGPWTLCSQPVLSTTGERSSESVLLVGQQPSPAQPLDNRALLVEVIESGRQYMIVGGYKHRIENAALVGAALQTEPWAQVGEAFVAGLPDGRPIAPIKPAAIGARSTAIAERSTTKIGQMFVVKVAGARQYFMATKDKLLPISALQYDIQRYYKPITAAYRGKPPYAIELSVLTVGRAAPMPDSATDPSDGNPPRTRPTFAAPSGGNSVICATFADGTRIPTVTIDVQLPPRDPVMITPKRGPQGTALADRVIITPGTAALTEALPSSRAPAGTLTLITDMGRAYPLATPDVLKLLGYESAKPTRLPAGLITRIPQGPGLNPATALRPAA